MTIVKGGLIQMALKGDTTMSPDQIRERMVAAHIPLIEEAGRKGVEVLCLQEVFTQPYFCPSQDAKWYAAVERIPEGPTTKLMQELAKKHSMVIVVPIYEEDFTGVYYNTAAVIDGDGKYLGKYRKNHIPQVAGFYEKFFFKPGNLGYPVFQTAYCKLGVYICYDRHFPEGWRALAERRGIHRQSSATWPASASISGSSTPAAAVAKLLHRRRHRVGTSSRGIGRFYGSAYFVNPRGKIIAKASEDKDELLVADMDWDMVREVRNPGSSMRPRPSTPTSRRFSDRRYPEPTPTSRRSRPQLRVKQPSRISAVMLAAAAAKSRSPSFLRPSTARTCTSKSA
jgi:N-carbamoylputrescine amidase